MISFLARFSFTGRPNTGMTWPRGRRGRAAEGGGLLNRYTLSRRIEGSNPSVSANNSTAIPAMWSRVIDERHETDAVIDPSHRLHEGEIGVVGRVDP